MVVKRKKKKSKVVKKDDLIERVEALESKLNRRAKKKYKEIELGLNEELKELEEYTKKNPMKAVAIAFIAGIILGTLGKRG